MPKPKKPPIDKKAVRERLEYAQERSLLVKVRRWIPDADRLDGFVVAVGPKWVALTQLADRSDLAGWDLLRLKDIQAVSVDPDPECYEVRALKAHQQWPPGAPDLALDDVFTVLRGASALAPLVAVHDEFWRPDACWIGLVAGLDKARLDLLEVDPRGEWLRKATAFDPADLTRLTVGGRYESALALVAGPPPARRRGGMSSPPQGARS